MERLADSLGLLLAIILFSSHTNAVEVTFEFAGVSGNDNTVEGRFKYDTDAPPCQLPTCLPHPTEPNSNIGRYPLSALELSVDDAPILFNNPSMVVTVINGLPEGASLDRLSVGVADTTQSFNIELTDLSGTLFVDDSLPFTFNRADFDTARPTGLIGGQSLGEDDTGDLTVLGSATDTLLEQAHTLVAKIQALDLSVFRGPNNKANSGLRKSLANRAIKAANAIASDDIEDAIDALDSLLNKIDGQAPPPDWMDDSQEKTDVAITVADLIVQLVASQ